MTEDAVFAELLQFNKDVDQWIAEADKATGVPFEIGHIPIVMKTADEIRAMGGLKTVRR